MNNKHNLINFFNNVMIKLNYYDWNINFCGDYYCWNDIKRIDIDLKYKGDVRQMILHEIAHVNTAKYCNQKHNPDFWKRLEYLNYKFLKKELDTNQKNHKKFMSNGYYKLCYKE